MTRNNSRRDFLKKLGAVSLGGGAFSVAAPRAWADSVAGRTYRRTMNAMGTLVNISVFEAPEARAAEAVRMAFDEIRMVEALMSVHRATTELSLMNQRSGSEMVALDRRTLEVLAASLAWSRATGGLFDATTLPLLRAYGFREETQAKDEARALVNYRGLKIEGDRAGLERAGAGVDLGGIAKGYSVDRAVALLRKCGLDKFVIEAGGDLYAAGHPEDAAGWTIGVKEPTLEPGIYATIELCDQAVATSGAYTRALRDADGRIISDSFDPATGEPVNAFLSVSAAARTCMDADAASTTAFVAANPDPGFLQGRAEIMMIQGAPGAYSHAASGAFPKLTLV